jgi:hypothetical protein
VRPHVGYVRFEGRIYLITRNFDLQKSRSGTKTMRLGLDKFTISKLDNIGLR